MDNEKAIVIRRMIIFFTFTFGMTALMGVVMGYGYYKGVDVTTLVMTQMFYPASGVMIAILATRKQINMLVPESFFITFLCMVGGMVIFSLGSVVYPQIFQRFMLTQLMCLLSLVAGLTILAQDKKIAKAYGLKGGNYKASIFVFCLFIFFYFFLTFISYSLEGEADSFIKILVNSNTWFMIIIGLVPLFCLSFLPFFGEEYGWRFYLQPAIQRKLGRRTGVILLGIIWGLWHLPVCLFYYSTPKEGVMAILTQMVGCVFIGVFFAYAYMRTGSIWTVSFLHFVNNSMFGILDADLNMVYGGEWIDFFKTAAVYAIPLGLLLLSKPFRDDKYKLPTLEERISLYQSAEEAYKNQEEELIKTDIS